MAHAVKIAVSMDEDTLTALDEGARRRATSRSQFVREAVRAALKVDEERLLEAQINAALARDDDNEALRRDAEQIFTISAARGGKGEEPW
jgi:metal-responsive CopG/Arc/MetJ family transcriptional regulator